MGKTGHYLEKVLREHAWWEKMPNQREPVTTDMIEFILAHAKSTPTDSITSALADWVILGEYTGA